MLDNSKTILLVEDNPDDVALTLRAFKKNNIMNKVVVAKDGVDALDYLFCSGDYSDRDIEDTPQIILLDLKLPKINGLEVLKKIREDERTRLLPVIILTSSNEQQDLLDGYSLGANSYIRKPVDFNQFIEAVRQLGLYWLVLNISPNEELIMVSSDCQRLLDDLNNEMDQLLYAISHDLRAPLRAIDGFSQAVEEDYADAIDDDGRDYLARVRDGSKKINAYIDGLLMISRESRGDLTPEKVDISSLALEAGARVAMNYDEHAPEFTAAQDVYMMIDRRLARLLLEKLLDNAWKFTVRSEAPKIEFGSMVVEGQTVCFLRDNGVGFDMQYAGNRLFGAFQRMHDQTDFPGLGTGLATARRIISRHGGKIWAESKPDVGTTIFFHAGEAS